MTTMTVPDTCPRCTAPLYKGEVRDEAYCRMCGPLYIGDVLGTGDELKRENCLGCGQFSRYSDLCKSCATNMKYRRGPKWR